MKWIKRLIIGLVGIVVVFAGVGFLLPGTVHVERSVAINAPADKVFPYVTDFRKFNKWSPWAQVDPTTKYVFEGETGEPGAKMSWTSEHPNVGAGSQTILAVDPNKRVEVELDFGDQGTATAFYSLVPSGTATEVTWGFDTDLGSNPLARYFGLMFDAWIGADYEKGLASLKMLVEASAVESTVP